MQKVSHLKTNKYIKIVSFLLFLLCIYIILKVLNHFGIVIYCPVSYFTGLYCPGCGVTRMFISLFKLDFYHAFRYNPLVFIYLILFIAYIVIDLFTGKLNKLVVNKKFLFFILFVTILYGVLRNFDMFSYLRPMN